MPQGRGQWPAGRARPAHRAGRGDDRHRASGIADDEPARTRGPSSRRSLDLVPALIGAVGLVAAGLDAGGNETWRSLRTFVGAAFLGAITDAMLLGHWYLVQPGLPRRLLNELVRAVLWMWPSRWS